MHCSTRQTQVSPFVAVAIALALVLLGALVVSCGADKRSRAPELVSEKIVAASRAEVSGEFPKAIALYREALRAEPDHTLARFALATLLQDHSKDYLGALYHYRTYLELAPNSEKAALAAQRSSEIERMLAAKYGGARGQDRVTSDAEIVGRIEELNRQIVEYKQRIEQLQTQVEDAQKESARLAKELNSKSNYIEIILSQGSAGPRPSSRELTARALDPPPPLPTHVDRHTGTATPPSDPIPANARKYRVKRNDTLWSIAQKLYGDASRNRDIRNANRGRLGPNDTLIEGTDLIIPMP